MDKNEVIIHYMNQSDDDFDVQKLREDFAKSKIKEGRRKTFLEIIKTLRMKMYSLIGK